MPSTPTISASSDPLTGVITVTIANPDSPSAGNNLYRYEASKGSSSEIKIASGIAVDGSFEDAGVGSEVDYVYTAEASDATTGTKRSAELDASVTFYGLRLHIVAETATKNYEGDILSLNNAGTADTEANYPSRVFFGVGYATPDVQTGRTLDKYYRGQLFFPTKDDVVLFQPALAMLRSQRTLCCRDRMGRVIFGVAEAESGINIDMSVNYYLPLNIGVSDYTGAVA